MQEISYNREQALHYAKTWALSRNKAYYNFDSLGGDCTNFASQVLFSGCGIMNYAYPLGWFYHSLNHRTPAWTGVEFLYKFLTQNKSTGPYAQSLHTPSALLPGDIIQLKFSGSVFQHTPVVVSVGKTGNLDEIYVAAHTYDVAHKRLTEYSWQDIRFLHILGARTW
ncbi:MAG: amidase domain-containing protein [Christensenellales bacterium]|jgi:hypothetical protein